ncbi:MAG: dihydrodipicolinate synthase family protein [Candidatus Latescibacterota bacterium]|nr:MAG: dihydrodipicolinate synthase family protein [Candidatus Latescibacterota bacterium]
MSFDRSAYGGVWVPLVTPFRRDSLDLEALERLVEWLLGRGVHGFVALGSTGEAPHLSEEESLQVVRCIVARVAGRVPVLVGSGRASTHQTLRAIERFAEAGAAATLVLTPFYYRAQMQAAQLRHHYEQLARESPLPLFVYHFPQVTGLDLQPELLAEIAQHPNVWGFKDSSATGGPLAAALQRLSTRAFVGSAGRIVEALEAGACGGILAVANLVPVACVQLVASWRAGERARAAALQEAVARVAAPLRGCAIAAIKSGLAHRGHPVGIPRAPLAPASVELATRIAEALDVALRETGGS